MKFNSLKKLKYWILAARIETLPLSISGIILGSFYAFYLGSFNSIIFFLSVITAISFQILSNFANDYGDGILGTDDNRIGPKRALASGNLSIKELRRGILINIFLAITFSYILIKYTFQNNYILILIFLFLSIACIIAAIKYTIGKNPYGYIGLGDIFVFVFFGLLSVIGTFFLHTNFIDYDIIVFGFILGFLCVGVLNLNNIRDIENDAKMNKKTIPTRIGFKLSKLYHNFLIVLPLLLTLAWSLNFEISYKYSLIILALIPFIFHLRSVHFTKTPGEFKPLLKQLAISTFIYSILISIFLVYESILF